MRLRKRKSAELKEHVRTVTTYPAGLTRPRARITMRQLTFLLETASSILLSVLSSASLGYYAFHVALEPQPFVYLVGIILSSFIGISIIFLLARKIYQQRKRERNEAIKGVRIKESQLFRTLEHDFERIVKPREVHGG